MVYSSSKTALNALTVHYARELAGTPVKVNGAAPGVVATHFNDFRGTPQGSAEVAVRLATLGADGPTGAVFEDDTRLAWSPGTANRIALRVVATACCSLRRRRGDGARIVARYPAVAAVTISLRARLRDGCACRARSGPVYGRMAPVAECR